MLFYLYLSKTYQLLILIFLFAFFISFIGSASPSLLNISCLKISLENGEKSAQNYSIGISLIIFFQVYAGIFIAKEINNFPGVISFLERFAMLIFFCLAYYFYTAYKNQKKQAAASIKKIKKPLLYGVAISAVNMFAIPFYFGAVTSLSIMGLFSYDWLTKLTFALGSSIGTYFILFFYGKYASLIDKKLNVLTKQINLLLSIVTAGVALLSLIKSIV